jgi:hypothetical protein
LSKNDSYSLESILKCGLVKCQNRWPKAQGAGHKAEIPLPDRPDVFHLPEACPVALVVLVIMVFMILIQFASPISPIRVSPGK